MPQHPRYWEIHLFLDRCQLVTDFPFLREALVPCHQLIVWLECTSKVFVEAFFACPCPFLFTIQPHRLVISINNSLGGKSPNNTTAWMERRYRHFLNYLSSNAFLWSRSHKPQSPSGDVNSSQLHHVVSVTTDWLRLHGPVTALTVTHEKTFALFYEYICHAGPLSKMWNGFIWLNERVLVFVFTIHCMCTHTQLAAGRKLLSVSYLPIKITKSHSEKLVPQSIWKKAKIGMLILWDAITEKRMPTQ